MSPEQLYQICLQRAYRHAHDDQSAQAAANGATAHIWAIPNKPADAHQDQRIWRYWAKYYVKESYMRENMTRDQAFLIEECEFEYDIRPRLDKDPDASYLEMLSEDTARRPVEAMIEAKETEIELMRLISNTLNPRQGRILVMYCQGYTADEIAEILETSTDTIYNLSYNARRKLRAANPDIGEMYAEFLMSFPPKRNPENKYKRHAEHKFERNVRTGQRSLHGRARSRTMLEQKAAYQC